MNDRTQSVVYLALGGRRVRAAQRYTADLAATGAQVLLVVADRAEWAGLTPADGVTVQRLGSGDVGATLAAARKTLLRRGGPLSSADLLIAGDPEATVIAEEARRSHGGLAIRLEPSAEPARTTSEADLAVVTPWYPSPDDPFAGAFVKATTGTVLSGYERVITLHTENWYYQPKGLTGTLLRTSFERLAEKSGGRVVEDTDEGELTRVPWSLAIGEDYAAWARAQTARLEATLPTGRIEAPLIHAHTGHYGGAIAAALARDDARIVVTEHATFLPKVFGQRRARRMYGEMLGRVDRLLCVGQYLYDLVAAQFPQYTHKLRIVPNPIDFDRFTVRPEPPAEPLRWLYVGRMLAHKGVLTLLEAFGKVASEEPRATLTLVGAGLLEDDLRDRIKEMGLTDRVTQHPAVPPDEVAGLMQRHDVLVHASHVETFGMTIVEAVATGTPVLVARSQGPAETMAGLDGVGGVLFEVTEDPAVIVEGYRRLKAGWADLDLAAAREQLRARYGREAVGEQLRAVFAEVTATNALPGHGAPAPAPVPLPAPDAERYVVVALDPPNGNRVRKLVEEARRAGFAVDLIVTKTGPWTEGFDAGVRLHTVGEREEKLFVPRLERFVVDGFPRRVTGYLRARAHEGSSPQAEAVAITVQRFQKRASGKIHRTLYGRYYANVRRSQALWRIIARDVLPKLDGDHTRRIVVQGLAGVTVAARIAKRWPGVAVTTSNDMPASERAGTTG
ncbi:glycosyltransferase family 4 protein [Actinoplanes sp. NPDC049265]|uniref:glycosyltransferase family 4 protein n=1 Tax=Actinoplanes sp. NPDC049265 TaxID=3363902 RepID=UPI00371B1E80